MFCTSQAIGSVVSDTASAVDQLPMICVNAGINKGQKHPSKPGCSAVGNFLHHFKFGSS